MVVLHGEQPKAQLLLTSVFSCVNFSHMTQCVCSTCMRVVLTTYISRIPDCGWGRVVWLAGVADMQSSTTEVFYEWVPTHMTQFTTQLGTDENENIQRSRASMQPCAQGCARETKQRSYMLMHTMIEPVCNRSTVTCTIDNRRVRGSPIPGHKLVASCLHR